MSEAARHTALLVVDGINAFYDPQGPDYYPKVDSTVGPILALLRRARERGTLIVHAVERHRAGLDDFEWRVLPEHSFTGTFDSEIFPPFTPMRSERELELHKRRFSAFFATDLALMLHEQRIATVVVAGVKTNVCIRATVQDAFANGFSVAVVREATNSNRPHLAEASLEDIARYMGRVVALEEAIELL
ncbi:MAG: cysteine hydrolase family protein [Gaiellaceae bacterium]